MKLLAKIGAGGWVWPKGIKVCHFVEWADGNGHWPITDAPEQQLRNKLQIKDLVDSCGIEPGKRLARDLL